MRLTWMLSLLFVTLLILANQSTYAQNSDEKSSEKITSHVLDPLEVTGIVEYFHSQEDRILIALTTHDGMPKIYRKTADFEQIYALLKESQQKQQYIQLTIQDPGFVIINAKLLNKFDSHANH